MDKNLCFSLITWLKTFPGHENITASSLADGVVLGTILHKIAPEYFNEQWVAKIKTDVSDNWRLKVSNLMKIHQGVMDYFYFTEIQNINQFPSPDLNKIAEHGDEVELGRLLQLILGCAINCEQKQKHIEVITRMEEGVQALLKDAIQDLMMSRDSPRSPDMYPPVGGGSGPFSPGGPLSFHPHFKTLVEQLENTSQAKDDLATRCNELELQITVLTEEKEAVREDNSKLLERIEVLETGGDIGAQSFRNKDLRRQIDALQDELYKVESSRDEYRSRVESLEKENKDVFARNEELQRLADESRALKDEVDSLRDMSERFAILEGTVETYKKKLEELSDLRRQVKILEEKNSQYMHHNMELEEEIKKSGTWRPQLDLYKKQVSDLHQKLNEESKKTDRQIFENKKLMEKLEALTQEKERLVVERDKLKENNEELKCTVSTLSSPDTGSRNPSDLSDIDTLEIIPPEIREKMVRLQHENRILKQKASENDSDSAPVLQSLLNDLQERHDKLLQENRWEKLSPPSPPNSFHHHPNWPPSGRMWPLDAYFMFDCPPVSKTSQNLKVLKRNLKWASESDLLILRQPPPQRANFFKSGGGGGGSGSIVSSNSSSKRKNSSPQAKSLTLPSNALAPVSGHSGNYNNNKDNPIVIHHIHEFKMAPSPTNEDSGCCRTSPSSCEGCEDHRSSGSYGIRTPDFGNTLDSGVSGMFRCLSPVIPSIVEECTTHHMSDIFPTIVNHEGVGTIPPVMYHSHPTHSTTSHPHTNCFCSSKPPTCEARADPAFPKLSSPNRNQNTATPYSTDSNVSSPPPQVARAEEASPPDVVTPVVHFQRSHSHSGGVGSTPQNLALCTQLTKQTTLPKKPEPPDSPTPHNSPRLPHSIHSNRLKGNKSTLSIGSTSYGSGIQEIPKLPNKLETRNSVSCEEIKPKSKNSTKLSKSTNPELSSSSQELEDSNEHLGNSKPYLETDLDTAFPNRYRASFRETNLDKFSGKLKSGIMNKVRSKSLDKYKAGGDNKLKVYKESSADDDLQNPRDSVNLNQIPRVSDPKHCVRRTEQAKPLCRSSESTSSSTSKDPVSRLSKANNRRSWGFENSSLYRSFKDNKLLSLSSRSQSESETNKGNNADGNESLLHKKSSSVSAGGNPSQRAGCPNQKPPKQSSSAFNINSHQRSSPSQQTLGSVSCHSLPHQHQRQEQSLNKKDSRKKPEVTLLTDTLFTHFVVSPKKKVNGCPTPCSNRSESVPSISSVQSLPVPLLSVPPSNSQAKKTKEGEPLLSDTDTDIELVENKLISSAFAAPLVSSESSTSMLVSDNNTDLDPSATDYCTETENDFNPRLYKLALTLENRKQGRPAGDHGKNVNNSVPVDDTDALITASTSPVVVVGGSLKKKKKLPSASKSKILNGGGIVKIKNKTAKAVVAETFNAMFTFCTP